MMNRGQGWRDVRRDRATKKRPIPEKDRDDAKALNAAPAVCAKPGEMYVARLCDKRQSVPMSLDREAYVPFYVPPESLILVVSAPERVKRKQRYRHRPERQFVWTCAVFVAGRAGWMRPDDFGTVVANVHGNGRRTW